MALSKEVLNQLETIPAIWYARVSKRGEDSYIQIVMLNKCVFGRFEFFSKEFTATFDLLKLTNGELFYRVDSALNSFDCYDVFDTQAQAIDAAKNWIINN